MKTNKNSPITNEGLWSQSELAVMEPQNTRAASFLGLYQDARFMKIRMGIAATRATLLAKGIHIDLTTLGLMIGFRIHIFIRREAYTALLSSIGGHHSVDFKDVLISLREVLVEKEQFDEPVEFFALGRRLVSHFGHVDHDDPRPAITLTLNPED